MQLVIRAVKKLVQEQSMDGVITVSSHVTIDAQLQRALFFKVGKPALILTNAPLELSDDSIGARRCVLATMTESDMELNFK